MPKTSKKVRVIIQLPKSTKAALDSLKDEGYTASSYIQDLVKDDLRVRRESGWVAGRGWVQPSDAPRAKSDAPKRGIAS